MPQILHSTEKQQVRTHLKLDERPHLWRKTELRKQLKGRETPKPKEQKIFYSMKSARAAGSITVLVLETEQSPHGAKTASLIHDEREIVHTAEDEAQAFVASLEGYENSTCM